MSEVKLVGEFDAMVWAKEFTKTAAAHPGLPTDVDSMVGWFANAIMAGYDRKASEVRSILNV